MSRRPVLAVAACAFASIAIACGRASTPPPLHPEEASSEELIRMAEVSERAGDSVRAEQYAAAAVEKGVAADRATRLLVRTCLASDRPRSALRYAGAYLARHPDDIPLRYLVAVTQQALGDAAPALKTAEALVDLRPDFAPAQYLLGITRRELGDLEGARSAFMAYVRLEPHGSRAAEVRALTGAKEGATPTFPVPKTLMGGHRDPHRRLPTNTLRRSRATELAARGS